MSTRRTPTGRQHPAGPARKRRTDHHEETGPAGPARGDAAPPRPESPQLDCSLLESLVGYNARRAWLAIAQLFGEQMADYGLKQVDFSVLSLLAHNPGATSRQLCTALNVLPPNMVSLIATMEQRGWIERRPHLSDGRAIGLHLTLQGRALIGEAETVVSQLEGDASQRLSPRERETLIRLLQKIYKRAD